MSVAADEVTCKRLMDLRIAEGGDAADIASKARRACECDIVSHDDASVSQEDVARFARWKYNAAVRGEIRQYRAKSQSPPPPDFNGDDEEYYRSYRARHGRHLPTCPHCKGKNLEPAALQTRSADEGPSIFMKCKACDKIVRPQYS